MDTIAAIATPPGFGGIGVIRVSGPAVPEIAVQLLGKLPKPRMAERIWLRVDQALLDEGIALFFPKPRSFTGEDVLELQCHGSPVVLDQVLNALSRLGVRLARPGEFSERAFLNGKLDLVQAEAIADLIESSTETAARLAANSLQGAFSRQINALVEDLTQLRVQVEGALDFPEEEIDFLDGVVREALADWIHALRALLAQAHQGYLVREGLHLVIAGPPNAGKSSLLNALSGQDAAIVTEVPGTTRDLLHREMQIDGLPIHLVDTAGLRAAQDPIEREGIRRARDQIARADGLLWVFDGTQTQEPSLENLPEVSASTQILWIRNKIDLLDQLPRRVEREGGVEIALSAREGTGLDLLRAELKRMAGYREPEGGQFLARRRHLDALERALRAAEKGQTLLAKNDPLELAAEELRQAQQALGEITGAVSSDALLGRIFASFCIGK